MINYKTKWNLPRTFNHCISPLLKSATHNNITPQIIFFEIIAHATAPVPAIYNTVSINLAPSLRTHKRTKTNYKLQSNNLCGALSNTNIPASRHYPHVPQPNRRHTTTNKTRHKLSTQPNRANPIADAPPTPTPTPSEKNDAIHPRPFPQFTIPFPLILRRHYAHTNEPKQITNCNQPALFGYLFHHYTTSTTAIPNQIFHKKESPRHNGGDAVLLSP